jgi:hypothetical protein
LLLSRPDLAIGSEIDVVLAALRWINHDSEARSVWTAGLMECVHLEDVNSGDVTALINKPDFVVAESEVKEIVMEELARALRQ